MLTPVANWRQGSASLNSTETVRAHLLTLTLFNDSGKFERICVVSAHEKSSFEPGLNKER